MTPEQEIHEIRIELLVYGFAAAKRIAELTNRTHGRMPCPLCHKELLFSIAPGNGHMKARCETENCIDTME